MDKWEYLEVMIYGGVGAQPDAVQANGKSMLPPKGERKIDPWSYLNQLGCEGWEMICQVHLGGNYRVYNFKRRTEV